MLDIRASQSYPKAVTLKSYVSLQHYCKYFEEGIEANKRRQRKVE